MSQRMKDLVSFIWQECVRRGMPVSPILMVALMAPSYQAAVSGVNQKLKEYFK